MPSTLRLASPIALAGLAMALAASAEPRLGNYSCEAERAVGLQGEPTSGPRYGGRIELPPAERHFGMTLSRAEIDRAKRCKPGKPRAPAPGDANDYTNWWFCRAKTELQFSPGKYEPSLRGDDLNIFRDRLTGWLHLADDLRYLFAYTDFAGNFFLEEGRCEAQ